MHDEAQEYYIGPIASADHHPEPHPLLAQVPLTVSPFLPLPTPVPLPYSYKQLPSTLPSSILQPFKVQQPGDGASSPNSQHQQPSAYVVSASGTSATPDMILASCVALQKHLRDLEKNARHTLQAWEDERKAAELAEKRRVAPGWLDNDVHMLQPENVTSVGEASSTSQPHTADHDSIANVCRNTDTQEGAELDRVFGRLGV